MAMNIQSGGGTGGWRWLIPAAVPHLSLPNRADALKPRTDGG
jgi:hypothetical protein